MIGYDEIREIARRDNEANPDNTDLEEFGVSTEAGVQFGHACVEAYAPLLALGAPVEMALQAAVIGGLRMGLLIAREQNVTVPDTVPGEWSE